MDLFFTVFPGNQKPVKRPMSDPTLDVGVDIQVPTVSQDRTIRFRERSVFYTEVFPRNQMHQNQVCVGGLSLGLVSKAQDTQKWTF